MKTITPKVKGTQDFKLISQFLGYRNKEDITNLPAGYLVEGSKNVLNTTGGRISVRPGYTLDGQANTTLAGITSSFDWLMYNGHERNLRAGNGKLEFRYVATAGDKYLTNTFTEGQVYWIPIVSSLSTATYFNFCDWWNSSAFQNRLLFVNRTPYIREWSGGVVTFLSGTVNTITKTGTTTWAEEGFTATGGFTIGTTTYTYTGGSGTTTLTGVSADTSAVAANSVVFQTVVTTANSSMTSIPSTFNNALIENLNQQIYVGALDSRPIYVSKLNNYTDFSFTSPVRLVGEGMVLYPEGNPTGFVPQEADMYISSGKNDWFQTEFTTSSDLTSETLKIKKLKTASLQAAQSQGLIGKIKNSVVFISNEPTLDELGRVQQILGTPQAVNMSDPIKNLFDKYDFTNGHIKYHKYFIYIAVPQEGVVLVYNLAKNFWEAPQSLPVGRFSVINGELYGHDYNVPQTYKLFDGYNDNGYAIEAIAKFSYMNYGLRAKTKYFNEYYFEGYIDKNTTLTAGITYEIDGCATPVEYNITGSDTQIVCLPSSVSSLGKDSLGKHPLGGELEQHDVNELPPKFRVIKTFPRVDFYEYQPIFSSIGIDYRWELLAFGPKVDRTMYGENEIKQ